MKVTIENTNYIVDNKGRVEIKESGSVDLQQLGLSFHHYGKFFEE